MPRGYQEARSTEDLKHNFVLPEKVSYASIACLFFFFPAFLALFRGRATKIIQRSQEKRNLRCPVWEARRKFTFSGPRNYLWKINAGFNL